MAMHFYIFGKTFIYIISETKGDSSCLLLEAYNKVPKRSRMVTLWVMSRDLMTSYWWHNAYYLPRRLLCWLATFIWASYVCWRGSRRCANVSGLMSTERLTVNSCCVNSGSRSLHYTARVTVGFPLSRIFEMP